ncbi:MAG: hypothetical protein ACK4KW_14745 [Gemmobacter sp.]
MIGDPARQFNSLGRAAASKRKRAFEMPTLRETLLAALHARISAMPAAGLRGDVLPERVPAAGPR